jgi:DNA-binding NtrC family response regulator
MKHEIAVFVSGKPQAKALCSILSKGPYTPVKLDSIADVQGYMQGRDSGALILDLDTEQITNAELGELKKKHPITIIALSQEQFHPRLEESLRHHIYACISKPVDPDELLYLLRSMFT